MVKKNAPPPQKTKTIDSLMMTNMMRKTSCISEGKDEYGAKTEGEKGAKKVENVGTLEHLENSRKMQQLKRGRESLLETDQCISGQYFKKVLRFLATLFSWLRSLFIDILHHPFGYP